MKRLLIALSLVLGISNLSAQYTDLVDFSGTGGSFTGQYPYGGALASSGNVLYGTTWLGGGGAGNIFSVHKDGSNFKNIVSFTGSGGSYPGSEPESSLLLVGAVLYGTTITGAGSGCVFSVDTDGTNYQVLVSFTGTTGSHLGASPSGALIISNGVLYGTASSGTASGLGCVFSVKTDGSDYRVLYSFTGLTGAHPNGALVQSGAVLYGMAVQGGFSSMGNIFSIDTDGTSFQNLIGFTGSSGSYLGDAPYGSLILSGGVLYGLTTGGGIFNDGCLFSVNTNGTNYQALVSFSGTSGSFPGNEPNGSLTLSGGILFGMTASGGSANDGCIFSVNTNGTNYHDLFNFTGSTGNFGNEPLGDLLLQGTTFYGMTHEGGPDNDGNVFSYGLLSSASVSKQNISCLGGSTGKATASPSGGASPYTYSWSDAGSQTTASATGLSAGAYTVVVHDVTNISVTASVTLTQPSTSIGGISIASVSSVSCSGIATVTANAATGGTPPYTYSWSGNNGTNLIVTGLIPGTYTLTAKDNNGCSATQQVTLTQPAIIGVKVATVTNILCSGSSGIIVANQATGGTSPYTYSWSGGGGTGLTVSNLSAGVYTITAKDINGCLATASATVTQPAPLTITIAGAFPDPCDFNGTIEANPATGGTSPYTYSWAPSGGTDLDIFNTSAGSYTITVTDLRGCTNTASVGLSPGNPPPYVSVNTVNNISCYGGTGSASVNTDILSYSGGSLFWQPSGGSGLTATGLIAGTYTVYAQTNGMGCSTSCTVTITQPTPLSISIAGAFPDPCDLNGTIEANQATGGTSPYTYSWAPSGGTDLDIFNTSAGSYTITVTDFRGCTNTASVGLSPGNPPPYVSVNTVNNISCYGGTGNATANAATGGTSPYTYSWSSGGGTNLVASNLSAGIYTITVTDNNGCAAAASATITEPSPLGVVTYTISTIAGTGTLGYNGDNISATSARVNSPNGVTVDNSGNIYIADYGNNRIRKVSTGGIISTIAGNGTMGYNGDNIAATSAELFGPTEVAIDGSGNIYIADYENNRIREVNTAGIIFTIAGTGADGYNGDNIAATDAELNNPTGIALDGSGNIYIADEDNNRIRKVNGGGIISTIAGTGSAGYNGDNIDATSAQVNNPYGVSVDRSGNIFIADQNNNRIRKMNTAGVISTIAGTGTFGYSGDNLAATSAELNNPTSVSADIYGNIYIADQHNSRLREVNTGGVISTIAGTLTSGYNADNIAATSAELNLPAGVALDGSGNIYIADTYNHRVRKIVPYVVVSITNTNVSCGGGNNGSATITGLSGGTSPYTYLWSNGSTAAVSTSNPTGSVLSAGTYSVTVTDNHGCTATGSITITQSPSFLGITVASTTNISCFGSTASATTNIATGGTLPYTYSWSAGGQSNLTATGLVAGTYTITVRDNGGCTASAFATITQPPQLGISIAYVTNVGCSSSFGSATANAATGGTPPYTYIWFPSGGINLTASALSAGTYSIYAIDNAGCFTQASATITQSSSPLSVSAFITTNITCNGGNNGVASATGSGGTSPYAYSWSNAGFTSSISGLSAGTYTVTVNDFNGCTATAYIGVGQPTAVAANAVVSTAISCNGGANGQAKVTATGGYSPYTYSWSPGGNSTYSSTGLSAGIYTITITDRNGCTGTSTVILTQPTAIRDSLASVSYPTCTVSTGSATIGVKGGTSPYRYTWTPNVSTTATATGLTVRGYVVIVKDLNGCTSTITFSISQPPVLRDSIVKASISYVTCGLSNNGSATVGIKYGTAPYTYSWNPTGNTTANASGLSVGTYTVTVQDANTCSATASVTISQAAGLTLSAIVTANITCNGSANAQAKVTVTGGVSPYTYSWSPNSGSTYLVTGLSAGTFTITVKDKNGCTNSTSVTVSQPAAIRDSVASITYPVSHGGTGSATIGVKGGTSPYRYSWTPNVSTTATGTGLTARTYTVQVKDANGCYNNVIFVITQPSTSVLAGKPVHKNALTGETDSLNYCCPDNINLYPNPNSGQFTITGIEKGMLIEVYDYTGRKISSIRANDITMQLNISNEPNGIYLIRIIDKDGNLVSPKKVMKVQ